MVHGTTKCPIVPPFRMHWWPHCSCTRLLQSCTFFWHMAKNIKKPRLPVGFPSVSLENLFFHFHISVIGVAWAPGWGKRQQRFQGPQPLGGLFVGTQHGIVAVEVWRLGSPEAKWDQMDMTCHGYMDNNNYIYVYIILYHSISTCIVCIHAHRFTLRMLTNPIPLSQLPHQTPRARP